MVDPTPSRPNLGARQLPRTAWVIPALLSISGLLCAPATAQAPQRAAAPTAKRPWESFEAPDGSSFLLVQTSGTGLIHWATASSCSPLEDPPGLEGLTQAVVERSLFGTLELGSRDPAREQFLAEGIVQRRAEFAQLYLRGIAPDPQKALELEQWQEEVQTLRDRGAYRRLMHSAPGRGPNLSMTESTAIVHVTTDMDGLRRVADLLRQRRESAALFGSGDRFAENRFDQISAWKAEPAARVRSEVAALAFLDGPLRRLGLAPAIPTVVSTAQMRRAWNTSQHPTRTVHVLVGEIDVERTKQVLSEIFATTDLPRPETSVPPLNQTRAQRQATLDGATTAGMFLAMPVPRSRLATAEACLRWLGEGDASALRIELTDRGLRDFQIQITYPFPDGLGHRASEGMALVSVQMGETDANAKNLGALRTAVTQALAATRDRAPPPPELAVFNAALSQEHNARKRDPAQLAQVLARTVLEGGKPNEVLAPWRPVTEKECRAFLSSTLSPVERIQVSWRTQ